jgi:hypothetical protein
VFFDDFRYASGADPALRARGWTVRAGADETQDAPPAAWSPDNVTFAPDPDQAGNTLAQLSARSGGGDNATEAHLSQVPKFAAGTYAARVRFASETGPVPAGDNVARQFGAFAPPTTDGQTRALAFAYVPDDPADAAPILVLSTLQAGEGPSDSRVGALEGWHALTAQVTGEAIRYYLDEALAATHAPGDPASALALYFSSQFQWNDAAVNEAARAYHLEVDWVYYAGGETLTPAEVEARVAEQRAAGAAFVDTVPARFPGGTAVGANIRVPGGPRPFQADLPAVTGIVIDGQLTDWAAEPLFTLDQEAQLVYRRPGAEWAGPADFSARAWAGWDAAGLYFAVDVTDETHVQVWSGSGLWQGDYVEVQLDTQLQADYDDPAMSDDDYQLGFSPGDFAELPPEAAVWFGPAAPEHIAAIQQAQAQTDTGYVIEVFLPRALLNGLVLEPGARLGLNINPSDTDAVGAPQKLMLSTSAIRALSDPTTLGDVTLR